ncbi:hypothetical protein GCM10017668_19810 [Streptomyces tuirus]|uniref:Uncharacterized protein n=1 Tax=Streptomyces tuirus TaxID=68278 RepID=A0A7G1NAI0_9ACTN|nr:hypothetical protein GCM10017668_19810 [Streptomyces tuirus]
MKIGREPLSVGQKCQHSNGLRAVCSQFRTARKRMKTAYRRLFGPYDSVAARGRVPVPVER